MKIADEQLETACDAMEAWCKEQGVYMGHRSIMKTTLEAAAPFLQIQWGRPTAEEVDRFGSKVFALLQPYRAPLMDRVVMALGGFVTQRNMDNIWAAFPNPPDPLRAAILSAIRKRDWPLDLEHELKLVDNVIAALDEVE